MGAITGLLLFPVMGPAWALGCLIERLREEAEASMDDEARGFAELTDLSMQRSAGTLSEAEFAAQETALLERLNTARQRRQELESEIDDVESMADVEIDDAESMAEVEC
jgi:hypothetical protein